MHQTVLQFLFLTSITALCVQLETLNAKEGSTEEQGYTTILPGGNNTVTENTTLENVRNITSAPSKSDSAGKPRQQFNNSLLIQYILQTSDVQETTKTHKDNPAKHFLKRYMSKNSQNRLANFSEMNNGYDNSDVGIPGYECTCMSNVMHCLYVIIDMELTGCMPGYFCCLRYAFQYNQRAINN